MRRPAEWAAGTGNSLPAACKFTKKRDVWAFGVTAWELLTDGEVPYGFITSTEAFAERLCGGERLTRPDECPDAL